MRSQILLALSLLLTASVGGSAWAIAHAVRTARRANRGTVVTGRVGALLPAGGAGEDATVVPVVAFSDLHGEDRRLTVPAAPADRYRIGQVIRVSYGTADPTRGEIVRDSGLLHAAVGLGLSLAFIAGLLLVMISLGLMNVP